MPAIKSGREDRNSDSSSPRPDRIKSTDASKLQDEYQKLVAGLQEANEGREEDDVLANPGEAKCAKFVVLRS